MNTRIQITVGLIAVLLGSMITQKVFADDEHKFIGVKKCAMCHKNDDKGNQYAQWQASKHSRAYETLGTDRALEVAEEKGVSGDPQEAPECLKCHVTAYGVDDYLLMPKFKMEDGVQCETCHGAGSDYKKASIMEDLELAKENGLIMPTQEICIKCHNEESPNFNGFNFEESFEKIKHPRPHE